MPPRARKQPQRPRAKETVRAILEATATINSVMNYCKPGCNSCSWNNGGLIGFAPDGVHLTDLKTHIVE